MDMEVLCNLLCEPPMLYLLVMIGWGIGLVPQLVGQQRHRLVWLSAILHLVAYAALIGQAVPRIAWIEIASAASRTTFLLTLGGYLLDWVKCHVAADFAIPMVWNPVCKRQSEHTR